MDVGYVGRLCPDPRLFLLQNRITTAQQAAIRKKHKLPQHQAPPTQHPPSLVPPLCIPYCVLSLGVQGVTAEAFAGVNPRLRQPRQVLRQPPPLSPAAALAAAAAAGGSRSARCSLP